MQNETELSLTEVIKDSLVLNPEPDNDDFEAAGVIPPDDEDSYFSEDDDDEQDESESDLESDLFLEKLTNNIEDSEDTDEDEAEAEDEDSSDDEEDEDEFDDSNLIRVKVDGEVLDVTLQELKSGYQRQSDYTRKSQALAEEKQELENSITEYSETLTALSELDTAWDSNPIQVLAHFASNTENPTQAVAMLIKELSVSNLLDRDFMEIFGITSDMQREWVNESRSTSNSLKAKETEENYKYQYQQEEFDKEVKSAVDSYDRDIDAIIDSEGVELTVKQRNAFRSNLAAYAVDNEITNLKAAYKAMKFDDSQNRKNIVSKATSRAKQKKAASVISRSGSGARGSVAIENNDTDLSTLIRQSMKEIGNS
jgi:hypothetical protein